MPRIISEVDAPTKDFKSRAHAIDQVKLSGFAVKRAQTKADIITETKKGPARAYPQLTPKKAAKIIKEDEYELKAPHDLLIKVNRVAQPKRAGRPKAKKVPEPPPLPTPKKFVPKMPPKVITKAYIERHAEKVKELKKEVKAADKKELSYDERLKIWRDLKEEYNNVGYARGMLVDRKRTPEQEEKFKELEKQYEILEKAVEEMEPKEVKEQRLKDEESERKHFELLNKRIAKEAEEEEERLIKKKSKELKERRAFSAGVEEAPKKKKKQKDF
jgi:hypothetical protein